MVNCEHCGKDKVDGFCIKCDDGCVEARLDSLTDLVYNNNNLSSEDINFLKVIKENRKDLVKKFSRVFGKI